MNRKLYSALLFVSLLGINFSCKDESLYPLPYGTQDTSGFLRVYKLTSNIFDITDITSNSGASTGFEGTYEIVDNSGGNEMQEVEFYVSHRRGSALTGEVLIKKIQPSAFTAVASPTQSSYKRANIRISFTETQTALLTLTDPDGTGPLVAYPGSVAIADQLIYRWVLVMKDGRRFSVANPQGTNPLENNTTANIATQPFYNAPYSVSVPIRSLTAGSWVGTYSLTQSAIWSPAHSWDFHANYPAYMKSILFPDQTVTLSTVSGGLSTEREFQVTYRGQTVKMKINLEPPASGTAGVVSVPLQNSTVDCSNTRELYWITPSTGSFTKAASSTVNLTFPLPTVTTPNRGTFNSSQTGLVAGQTLIIGLDDDADEYGLRNGYCTWTRTVRLTLTKL
jgi:hypothetical protein